MFRKLLLVALCAGATIATKAQQLPAVLTADSVQKNLDQVKKDLDVMKNLKVSGWVQAQFQIADTAGAKNYDGGDFTPASNNRFMIRRGRVKFTYTNKNTQYVMQINGTERGMSLVEIFAKYSDPWTNNFSFTGGVQNRPFGYEIQQSSADRESPERSRFSQMTLPNERDLGLMFSYQPSKHEHKLHGLKVDAGFFNGTGIAVPGTGTPAGAAIGTTGVSGLTDFDSKKDFMGHAAYYKHLKADKYKIGVGMSHYNGGFLYQNNKVYDNIQTVGATKNWVIADTVNKTYKNGFAPRKYFGLEGFLSAKTNLGTTIIRGEYFFGTQTGTDASAKSAQVMPSSTAAMYVRNFTAGYVYLIQKIGEKGKHEVALKYEWIDPNKKVSSSDLTGLNGMKEGEIKYNMYSVSYNVFIAPQVKLMFNYNIVKNEVTGIKNFSKDLKDNVLTARVQYRF